MITVIIVEDQKEHQEYLKGILDSDLEIKCLQVIDNGLTAIREIERLQPDIVLMDIGLPGKNGIDCIATLRTKALQTKFMVCTVSEEDEKVFDAIKSGAHSYIVKKSKPYQILDAIKELKAGNAPISSCIANKILNHFPVQKNTEEAKEKFHITSREHQILILLSKGNLYKEISDELCISIKTLKWHIHNIYVKLHADNRTEAINTYFG